MRKAISNTSPLLYLHRIEGMTWLPRLFDNVRIPSAVVQELDRGRQQGYSTPNPAEYDWLQVVEPRAVPSEWLALDLGPGELAAMSLALENMDCTLLLDDSLARRTAQAAGLEVWGTLRILLEAKARGWTERVEPSLDRLANAGMWLSESIRRRILTLAGEA